MQAAPKHMHSLSMHTSEAPLIKKKVVFGVRFKNWMVNDGMYPAPAYQTPGPHRIFVILWTLAQLAYFIQSYIQLDTAPNLSIIRSSIHWGLPVARGAANVITLNSAVILMTVCRNLISKLRQTFLNKIVPLDKSITYHIFIAWSIVFWSFVHCIAHYFNYLFLNDALNGFRTAEWLALESGPGLTGHVIVVAFFLMVTSAMENVRRKYFEIFWFTHHLYIIFFGVSLIHGCFCFIKADPGPGVDECRGGPTFWKWCSASFIAFICERIAREIVGRKSTFISKVVQHPSKTIEVQIKKPSCKTQAGQYVFLCCPEISAFEWHPFTLTSSPHEEFISVHIRIVGDWTTKFAERLGVQLENGKAIPLNTSLPFIMVDGPYGSASEDVFNYEVAILCGAGIGVTPFASILKTIWYKLSQPEGLKLLKKVYFVWTCRDQEAFGWFQDLLQTLEEDVTNGGPRFRNFLSINSYLTSQLSIDHAHNIFLQEGDECNEKDTITGLRSRTFYGRPNFDEIFRKIRLVHVATDVGVFFCGPTGLSSKLHAACNRWTESHKGGTRFFYGKENF